MNNLHITNEDNMVMMARYPDNAFNLAIVDPPYFKGVGKMGYFGKTSSTIGVKRGGYNIPNWDDQVPSREYFSELKRVSRHQIIWGINYYDYIHCAGRIVWDKVKDSSSFSKCEIASCSLIETVQVFRFMWNGMQQGSSKDGTITQGNKQLNEKRIHPTQKPVRLYEYLLMNYAKTGDKILDTHLGSGSIAIACHNLGFELTACELDKDYYAAAIKRIKAVTSQKRMFT